MIGSWEEFRATTWGLSAKDRLEVFAELTPSEQIAVIGERNGRPFPSEPEPAKVDTYPAGERLMAEPEVAAIWGAGQKVLWAEGEALWFVAEGGLGKSTIAQQLALARAGISEPELLDYPVEVDAKRVLYIAADRPRQLYRSFRRMIRPEQVPDLDQALVFAEDVPVPLSADPDAFVQWVEDIPEIGTVFIDSLKDVASDLGADSEGNNVNLALKNLIHSGREVVVLHHNRKLDQQGGQRKPRQADVYGSRWLAAGAGSIFFLTGDPGTARVQAHHVKSPMSNLGTLDLRHDFVRGTTEMDWGVPSDEF